MQIRCIAREDASALQQAGYEAYMGPGVVPDVPPEDTTYVQLCQGMSMMYPVVPLLTIHLDLECGVGFWGKASVQACVSPEFGIAAEIVPGATFVARTKASVAFVMIRGGVEGEFSSQASVVAGVEIDLPWRICPTVGLEVVPLIVKVRAFVEVGVMWWWTPIRRWPIAEWRSGCEPPVRMLFLKQSLLGSGSVLVQDILVYSTAAGQAWYKACLVETSSKIAWCVQQWWDRDDLANFQLQALNPKPSCRRD
jgi:hypothetical protein